MSIPVDTRPRESYSLFMKTTDQMVAEHEAADRSVLEAINAGASDSEVRRLQRARADIELKIDAAALAPYVARTLAVLRGGGGLTSEHKRGFEAARIAGYATGTLRKAALTDTGRTVIEARIASLHGARQ